MKKILLLLSVVIMESCCFTHRPIEEKRRINCDFQGGVVLSKYLSYPIAYDIQYQGEVYNVLPYDIDKGYNVGDTINKPCLQN